MFAYILRSDNMESTPQTDGFFQRFLKTPGLLYAFELEGVEDKKDAMLVAVWEDREAAQRYIDSSPLRKEVDASLPKVTRTMYQVVASSSD